jgi:hypothetical protein
VAGAATQHPAVVTARRGRLARSVERRPAVGATRHLAAVTTPCGRPQRGAGGRRELRASFVHPNLLLSAQDLSLQSTLGDSLYNSAAVSTAASEHETQPSSRERTARPSTHSEEGVFEKKPGLESAHSRLLYMP